MVTLATGERSLGGGTAEYVVRLDFLSFSPLRELNRIPKFGSKALVCVAELLEGMTLVSWTSNQGNDDIISSSEHTRQVPS